MTGGVVTGGWEFVWAAYGITIGVLIVYSLSVYLRLKHERERDRSGR